MIPATADDPLALLRLLHPSGNRLHDLVQRARSAQVDASQTVAAQTRKMGVGVDQPRQHRLAGQIDGARPGLSQSQHVAPRTDRDDAVARDRQRLGPRPRGVERVDVGIYVDRLRRRRLCEEIKRPETGQRQHRQPYADASTHTAPRSMVSLISDNIPTRRMV